MKIEIRLFALVKDVVGTDRISLEVEDPAVIEDVMDILLQKDPELRPMRNSLKFAIHDEFAELSTPLKDGQELSIIPPVSGG